MSLVFVDGFDHYSTAEIGNKWNSVGSGFLDIKPTGGREGGGALYVYSGFEYYSTATKTISSTGTVIIGVRIKFEVLGNNNNAVIALKDQDGNTHLSLRPESNGAISVMRGNGTGALLATSTNTLTGAVYTYLEFKATISDLAGSYEVRVDGATWLSGSGVDTQNSATASVSQVMFGSHDNSKLYLDDLYICDNQGTINNDFLGDIKVQAIYPNAEGANSGLTPLSGTDHYAMVNQNPPDGDTTYNSAATTGAKDTYGFSDIPLNGDSILGVQVLANCRKEDAGSRGVKLIARPGVTDNVSPALPASVDYSYHSYLWEQNPDTGAAWTESEVNATEFGLEVSD